LRRGLIRKLKPAEIEDPAQVPMKIFFEFVKCEGSLFKKFMRLSRGFRKHLLYHIFTEYMIPVADSFNSRYR
jgi:hypothetical protein